MDQKISQFYSSAQNQSTTFENGFFISKFGHSWLKLEDHELECAKLTTESFDFTISFPDKREFCGVLEATGNGGYFMINYSIRLKNYAEETLQDKHMGIVDCKCLLAVAIAQTDFRDFYAKGSFQTQIHKDKASLLADASIECDGQIFQAHKSVLSCASTVFARMLASSMVEATTKMIKIDDQNSSTIQRMLDFIYTGEFTGLPDDALVDQLYCAEKYDLEELKAAASLHMVSTVSDFNVIEFLDAAMKCNVSRDVMDKLVQHCKRNFQYLSTVAGFKEFFAKHFDEFFCNHHVTGNAVESS